MIRTMEHWFVQLTRAVIYRGTKPRPTNNALLTAPQRLRCDRLCI